MSTKYGYFIFILFGLTVFLGVGCAPKNQDADKTMIGVIVGGSDARLEMSMVRALEVADAQSVRKDIGFFVEKIECSQKEAQKKLKKMAKNKKMVGLIAGGCPEVVREVAFFAKEKQIPNITPTYTESDFNEFGDFNLRTMPEDRVRPEKMAKDLFMKGLKRATVVYDAESVYPAFAEIFTERFLAWGGTLAEKKAFVSSALLPEETVNFIMNQSPDLVVIATPSGKAIVELLENIRRTVGSNVSMPSIYVLEEANIEEKIHENPDLFSDLRIYVLSNGNEEFTMRYMQISNGSMPGPFAAQTHDAYMAFVQALSVSAEGETNEKQFLETLKKIDFDGALGPIRFDDSGSVPAYFETFLVRDGIIQQE